MESAHLFPAFCLITGLCSCAAPDPGVDSVGLQRELAARAGVSSDQDVGGELPPGVTLEDGLDRDEAVAIALWSSPDLAASLAELDVARAAVAEAGLLRDPLFTFLFPLGPKQLEATLSLPIDALWLRDRRIAVAAADAQRLASELITRGIGLIHAVALAFNEVELAGARARIAGERLQVQRETARLDAIRLEVGEIAAVDEQRARLDLQLAQENAARAGEALESAMRALRAVLGRDEDLPAFELALDDEPDMQATASREELRMLALICRPDLRAAELEIEAASERLGLSRKDAWHITAILDANGEGSDGFEAGPGVSTNLPIFAGSRGSEARAKAELELASARYAALRARILYEVEERSAALANARRSAEEWTHRIVPAARATLETARAAYASGDASPLDVLQRELAVLDVSLSEAEATLTVQRARADLERVVGRRDLGKGVALP